MFKVGQEVMVTDQRPPAKGIVEEVSTWREVLRLGDDDDPCYYIRCGEWQGTARWIGGIFVKPEVVPSDA